MLWSVAASSLWRSPVITKKQVSEISSFALRENWYPFRCVGHISRSTWVFRRCYQGIFFSCEFGCLSFVKHKPWAVWFRFVERKIKACMFYEPQLDQISQNISLPDSSKSVEFDLPTILIGELLRILNFVGLTVLTAFIIFNQSDYLNHFNKGFDRLI